MHSHLIYHAALHQCGTRFFLRHLPIYTGNRDGRLQYILLTQFTRAIFE